MDNILTTQEAADFLGIKKGTFSHYVKTGLIKSIPNRKSPRRSNLFYQSILEEFKKKPAFASNTGTTTKRSLYRSNTYKHKIITEDQVFPNGCIIFWTKRFRENNTTFIPMKCKSCGKEVSKRIPQLYNAIDTGVFTGCCKDCSPGHRKNISLRKGWTAQPDGYIRRHIRSFPQEEREILIPMTVTDSYILEHRAIMAVHLGRSLESREVIHHINGDKGDNRLENLVLSTTNEHNSTHAEAQERLNQLIKRVKELEEENQELRSLTKR